eukprot:5539691-Pyramimonas_sp.AAC.1
MGAAPLELWHMRFLPQPRKGAPQARGAGASTEPARTDAFKFPANAGLAKIRKHQQTTLYWRASSACRLRKSGPLGPRGRR